MGKNLENVLDQYRKISLEEIGTASLQDRIDSKFIMHRNGLAGMLEQMTNHYRVMEIDTQTVLGYKTLYFDTPDLSLYRTHHNGKLNRLKVRTREYLQNGQVFNEVKRKINRGKTFKSRQGTPTLNEQFDETFQQFLARKCPELTGELVPQLYVHYNRITLVANDFSERITIDTELAMEHREKRRLFENLVIVELKRGRNRDSATDLTFKRSGCVPSGFSKYCIGIATTHEKVKLNNFKAKIRMVEKLCVKNGASA